MALDLEVTTNLPADETPSGHTPPATTNTFTDAQSINFTHTIASSGITHATVAATGLTALVAAMTTWLTNTFIPTTLGIDVTANTVTAIATIRRAARANDGFSNATDPNIYITGTDEFTVVGTLQWEIS